MIVWNLSDFICSVLTSGCSGGGLASLGVFWNLVVWVVYVNLLVLSISLLCLGWVRVDFWCFDIYGFDGTSVSEFGVFGILFIFCLVGCSC